VDESPHLRLPSFCSKGNGKKCAPEPDKMSPFGSTARESTAASWPSNVARHCPPPHTRSVLQDGELNVITSALGKSTARVTFWPSHVARHCLPPHTRSILQDGELNVITSALGKSIACALRFGPPMWPGTAPHPTHAASCKMGNRTV